MVHVDDHILPIFSTSVLINGSSVLATVLAIICMLYNNKVDSYIRLIILSYLVGNTVGCVLTACDTMGILLYHHDTVERDYHLMSISVMLSLTHLIILMLGEYVILTARARRGATDFAGLISLCWIMSVTTGMVNVVSPSKGRLVFAILFFLVLIFLIISYFVLMEKHEKMKQFQLKYQKAFLRERKRRCSGTIMVRRSVKLKFLLIAIASYTTCSLPWAINEMLEGFGIHSHNHLTHPSVLIAYSCNFFFPALICIYSKYVTWKQHSNTLVRYIDTQASYRYRDMSLVYLHDEDEVVLGGGKGRRKKSTSILL